MEKTKKRNSNGTWQKLNSNSAFFNFEPPKKKKEKHFIFIPFFSLVRVLLLLVEVVLHLGEVEVLAGAAPEHVEDVDASRLEVRRRVVALRDEQLRRDAAVDRIEDVADLDELLLDGSEKGNT